MYPIIKFWDLWLLLFRRISQTKYFSFIKTNKDNELSFRNFNTPRAGASDEFTMKLALFNSVVFHMAIRQTRRMMCSPLLTKETKATAA
jgi:hypothetical protein